MPNNAPDKVVDVPSLGVVSFPGSMSDAEISEAIKGHFAASAPAADQARQALINTPMQQSALAPEGGTFNPLAHGDPNSYPGASVHAFLNKPEVQAAMNVLTPGMASGALQGPEALLGKAAPNVAESALNITANMRARGRQIGEAVLENTHGITASKLVPEIKEALSNITADMENAVHAATQSGATGSTANAQQALNQAISKVPRNASDLSKKLSSLSDLLHLGDAAQTSYTPDELLEMKRGIGKAIQTWGPEWQKISDVQGAKQSIYGAIDSELDRLVPGNAEKNALISSLIPAKSQAQKISGGATIGQRILARYGAHTGALVGAAAGGTYGYEKGGTLGAIAGTVAGSAVPEAIASTPGKMAVARLLNSVGDTSLTPAMIRVLATLASDQNQQPNTPGMPFHPGAGVTR